MDRLLSNPASRWQPASGPGNKLAANGAAREETAAAAIAQILPVIERGQRFLVTSHCRPDGDAIGSILAMGMLLEQKGKHADLVIADPVPHVYRSLPGVASIHPAMRAHGPYDAVILLECDGISRARLRGLEDQFLINIDHHVTSSAYGNINWIDCDAASVGEMVYRLARAAGVTLTPQMATCLYTTLLTDTGGFCYGATQPATFALAHELTSAGADPIRIAQDVYFSASMAKMLLLGAALRNLRREGRLAWLWVTHQDMVGSCATEEDCEGIVNYAVCIAGVEAAVFLRELPDRRVRLGLRSKGGVDVAAIAARFSGGGHAAASGCTLEGPLSRAVETILAEMRPAVEQVAGTTA